jgi:hypothetical protein
VAEHGWHQTALQCRNRNSVEHCIAHAQHSFAAALLLPHCCTRAGVVSAGTDAFKFTAAAAAQRSLHVQ